MSIPVPLYGFGSGGASLNFKVVGGLTQPTDPKENTIWVQTSARITSWIFAPSAPSAPEDGLLWIQTGAAGPIEFNALKKNGIVVYPLSARHYVGGRWAEVEAMSYLEGAWMEWIADIMVYNSGATGVALDLTSAVNAGAYLNLTLGKNGNATVKSELLNISGHAVLEVVYSNLAGNGTFAGGIQAQVWDAGGKTVAQTGRRTESSGTLVLDVSALIGEYRVGVYANNTSGSYAGSCRVESIKVLISADAAALAAKAAAYDILMEGVSE